MIAPYIMPRVPIRTSPARTNRNADKNRVIEDDDDDDLTRFELRPVQEDPDILLVLKEGARANGTKKTVFARQAIRAATERLKSGLPISGVGITNREEGGPLLDVRVACGPLEEARESATKTFKISKSVADEIGFRKDSSFFARTRGESMEGAGIPNEAVVCFLPLNLDREPQPRQIALVAFEDEGGAVLGGTVKRWTRNEKGELKLLNGEGKVVPLPKGTFKVRAVATATGVVGGL